MPGSIGDTRRQGDGASKGRTCMCVRANDQLHEKAGIQRVRMCVCSERAHPPGWCASVAVGAFAGSTRRVLSCAGRRCQDPATAKRPHMPAGQGRAARRLASHERKTKRLNTTLPMLGPLTSEGVVVQRQGAQLRVCCPLLRQAACQLVVRRTEHHCAPCRILSRKRACEGAPSRVRGVRDVIPSSCMLGPFGPR